MDNLIETINNYIHEENQYALQIDGEWGTGKTYFIKNTIIKDLCEDPDYHSLYFSVYGYNNLPELKQDLFNKILSEISKNQKILRSINSISKRFSKLSKSLGYTKFSSISLISDWIVEASSNAGMKKVTTEPLIIFIDDLERISKNIDLKDLLGFILNELLEKLRCKVIILSNSSEIKNFDDFKKIKEKVINRTIKFTYDISTIEQQILKKSNNLFIQENSYWIKNIIEIYQKTEDNSGVNLRTLFSVIESFNFIESNLRDDIDALETDELKLNIKKSLFLNIFVITREYKLGTLTEENIKQLKRLINTKYFYSFNENKSENIAELIIDKYHNKYEIFDNYVFYSESICSYILLGYFNGTDYVSAWKNVISNISTEISNLDKMNDFRRLNDTQLKNIQQRVLQDVRSNTFDTIELITVYGRFYNFNKMDLVLIDDNYIDLIESKIIESYSNNGQNIDILEEFFMKGINNIKSERPEFYKRLKNVEEQRKTDDINNFVETLFTEGIDSIVEQVRSGLLTNNNLFTAIICGHFIEDYIVTDNNKADILWQLIRSEYLNISNAKDFHSEEVGDIRNLLTKIKTAESEKSLGKIDSFKIKQLNESLEQLIEHLK
ncbi:P-loop NTPase fold protein [Enterococcus faecalis]|uniref:P-loop NTPase fold protein n=1 Tax=Enterococcus faecalis TaxID=1351 RepID=UPI00115CC95D|nr:P-loop NTPase fold protein [Enterococcus faecalis]